MNFRTILLLLLLGGIAAFAAVNWAVFTAPTSLSLIVMTIQAPLGLVMLGLTALLAIVSLAFATHFKTTMLMENRDHGRDMQALRKLADQAEASRLTDLQRFLEGELRKHEEQRGAEKMEVLHRVEEVERNVRAMVEQSGNTLAAYIGELDDRLERENGKPATDRIG
jgi:hypothetical protein